MHPRPDAHTPTPPAAGRIALAASLLVAGCWAPLAAGPPGQLPPGATPAGRILQLEDQRVLELDDGLPDLKYYFRSPDIEVRERAALAAGRIGGGRAAKLLRRALRDEDAEVRRAAAFAQGETGSKSAVGPLVAALEDPDPGVRALSAEGLSKLGDASALGHLERLLDRESGDRGEAEVLERLLLTAWRLQPDGWTGAVLDLLDHVDPAVREAGIYFLMRRPDPAARTKMQAILAGDGPDLHRAWAARALGAADHPAATAALAEALDDPSYQVAIEAARALGRHPRAAGIEPLLAAARRPEPHVRLAALGALAALAGEEMSREAQTATRELLLDRMTVSDAESAPALQAIVALDAELAAPLLRAAGSLPRDWRLRAAAADAVAHGGEDPHLPWPVADELLTLMLDDPDPRVLWHVVAAYGAFAGDDAPDEVRARAAAVARHALTHADPVVRAVAAETLQRVGSDLFPLFAFCLRDALDDVANDAAIACLQAGVAVGSDEEARQLLEIALETDDPVLRRIAGDLQEERFGEFPRDRVYPAVESLVREQGEAQVLRAYSALADGGMLATRALVKLEDGRRVRLRLFPHEAPMTVRNFARLAEAGYFDGVTIHRVVPDFVVQDGDPRGDGWGGPGWAIRDEINRHRYHVGAVGMALAGPDTGGSQWFVALSPQPHLDGGYTVFGRVEDGLATLREILPGTRIETIETR